jgi:L-fucose isomerase-like protein
VESQQNNYLPNNRKALLVFIFKTLHHRCGFYNEEIFKIVVIKTETYFFRGVTLKIVNN